MGASQWVPPCLAATLMSSSVSTSPPIKARFSALTKHLSAHTPLPAWLLLVSFVPIVVGHPHLHISRLDSISCADSSALEQGASSTGPAERSYI